MTGSVLVCAAVAPVCEPDALHLRVHPLLRNPVSALRVTAVCAKLCSAGVRSMCGVVDSREFSWKIKGISMSVFTEEEAKALKRGGNQVSACYRHYFARSSVRDWCVWDTVGGRKCVEMQ